MSVLAGSPTSLALTWEPHPDGWLILGGLLLWAVIAVLLFKWAEEHRTGGPDPLYWSDLEPELALTGPGLGSDAPPTNSDR